MKIACLIHSLCGGGAERVMARLASMLSERGHDVLLITFDDATEDRHEVAANVRRIPLDVVAKSKHGLAKPVTIQRRLAAIRAMIRHEQPAVVLSFCDRNNIDVLLATIGLSIPIILSERSDPARQTVGRFWEFVRRRVYPRASRIIALTPAIAETLAPLSNEPIIVIPSAVDPVIDTRPYGQRDKVVLGAGRLEFEKGFDRLIDAFASVADKHSDWNLRILGEGSMRNGLQHQIDGLGLSQRIEMPGWIRPIAPEYLKASLFVLPSRYEGFPAVLLEAMAAGTPPIAMTCQSGSCQVITPEINGLLVSDQPGELAAAIDRMITDVLLRERFAVDAAAVSKRYTWDKMVSDYEAVIEATAAP